MTEPLIEALGRSRELGFLGPGPVQEHVSHALAFAEAVSLPPARALDLGAGGGLPGLVLADRCWPITRWTFLDSQRRRTDFLTETVERMGLEGRVEVVTERAEVLGRDPDHRGQYDLVVSRSFGAPAVTAECSAPFLREGGRLVVSEPPTGSAERWPDAGVASAGFLPGTPVALAHAHLMVFERNGDEIEHLPRRSGIPAKRPLFT